MRQLAPNVIYSPKYGSIMLFLPLIPLPKEFTYKGTIFEAKQELHVSLINARKVAEKYGVLEEDIVASVEYFLVHQTISFEEYTGEFYHCTKAEGQTIIVRAFMNELENLYDELRKIPGLHTLPSPVPHVTLYKYNRQFGIAVPNEEALAKRCAAVDSQAAKKFTEMLYGEDKSYPL